MKIVHIVEATVGGAGRHVIDLIEGQTAAGHEVHLIYSETRMDGVFRARLDEFRAAHPELPLQRLDMRRSPHPYDLAAIWRARRYLRRHGPFDVVHTHCTKAGLVGRVAALGLSSARIYTPNAFLSLRPDYPPLATYAVMKLERTLARFTDGVIAVSIDEREHGLRMGIPESRMFLVANGLKQRAQPRPDKRVALRRAWQVPEDGICVGMVGRLVPQKNPLLALRAFGAAHKVCPQLRLVLVGDGPLERQMRLECDRSGLTQAVVMAGFGDGYSSMCGFDIFLLSSDYEGLPYVLLEALDRGLPIVTTRVGGVAELVAHDKNGFVTATGDHAALAEALITLARDEVARSEMASRSRRRIIAFTVDKMVESVHAVYTQTTEKYLRST